MDDRAEAIDILTRMSTNHFYGHREQEALKLGAEALKQRWIPVTERLPLAGEAVLVTVADEDGFDRVVGFDHLTKGGLFIGYGRFVRAWMPLPSPYKGGEEE